MRKNKNLKDPSFDNNLYETPQDFFDRVDREFRFDIDAAAEPHTAKCKEFYTREQNVLAMNFIGKSIWLNPPYNDPVYRMKDWIAWAEDQCYGYLSTVVCLVPSSTQTGWWHDCIFSAAEIRNIKGRLHFLANKIPKTQTMHNNSLVVFIPGMCGPFLRSMEARIKLPETEE